MFAVWTSSLSFGRSSEKIRLKVSDLRKIFVFNSDQSSQSLNFFYRSWSPRNSHFRKIEQCMLRGIQLHCKTTLIYSIFTFQTIEAVIYLIFFRVRASRHEMSSYSIEFLKKKTYIKHQAPHGLSVPPIDLIISAKFQD